MRVYVWEGGRGGGPERKRPMKVPAPYPQIYNPNVFVRAICLHSLQTFLTMCNEDGDNN